MEPQETQRDIVASNGTTGVPTMPQILPNPPTSNTADQQSTDGKKPQVIVVISILLFLLAVLYLYSTGSLILVMLVLNKVIRTAGGLGDVFELSPAFGGLPITYSLIAFVYVLLACKIKDGSKKSFWFVLITMIASALVVGIASYFLFRSLNISFEYTETSEGNLFDLNKITSILGPGLVFNLITLIILVVSYKKFQFEPSSISKLGKILLILVFVFVILPVNAYVVYNLVKPPDTDYGYTQLTPAVSFHIYKPTHLPGNFVNTTSYRISDKNLPGLGTTVTTSFGYPLKEEMQQETPTMIIMNQAEVDADFDLQGFIDSVSDDKTLRSEVGINTAVNTSGYLLEKTVGKLELKYLYFVTNDNVLIQLAGPNISAQEITTIANALQ